LAVALAEAGASVDLVARSGDEVEAVAGRLRACGHRASALALDVGDAVAVQEALADRPCPDILVNNAGTNRPKPFVEVTGADYDAVVGLNLEAAFFVTQAVAERLLAAGRGGSIINVTSQMGHVGAANRSLYCASKHALEGLTKALAVELGPHGIRVNAIAPTFVETPMTRPFLAEDAFRCSVLAKIHLGRLAQPEDLMAAVVFLAGEGARMVTGCSLRVDGGWTAE
jgi:NAD(P)-dependent dehydrogenase (short-subunit alcohol dehydrogenase family)